MFRRLFGRGEFTRVSRETEIGIPRATYVLQCLIGIIALKGCFLICMLVWILDYIQTKKLLDWFNVFWTKFFVRFWPVLLIPDILWCIGIPLFMWFIRMSFEQIFKQWNVVNLFGKDDKK